LLAKATPISPQICRNRQTSIVNTTTMEEIRWRS
jgi:hypothetical protein